MVTPVTPPVVVVISTVSPVPVPTLVVGTPLALEYPVPACEIAVRVLTVFTADADTTVMVALLVGAVPSKFVPAIVTVSVAT